MALIGSNSEIGPNSLEMYPLSEQELNDFCTGEVLTAALRSEAEYSCVISPASVDAPGTPLYEELATAQQLTQANLESNTSLTQNVIDGYAVPVITDDELSGAPSIVPLGSSQTSAEPVYSPTQIAAAQHAPLNWAQTMTLQPRVRRRIPATMQRPRAAGITREQPQPTPVWGQASGSRNGWCCGVQSNPWGKLFLLGGLGLIIYGLLDQ